MRRFATSTSSIACIAASSTFITNRSIFTTWGSIPCEKEQKKYSWLSRITNQWRYRSFEFWHVPEVETPAGLRFTPVETYLLSCIEDDAQRLLSIDWTYDFDPFWRDRVNSHDILFRIIYTDSFPIYRYLFGNHSKKTAEKAYVESRLNYLNSVMHWAAMTERRFTAIAKARYYVQRKVWNAVERERYLAGCVEIVDSFKEKIPEEFREKAISELEVHLANMRHWCWDCPNAKRTFTRQLA